MIKIIPNGKQWVSSFAKLNLNKMPHGVLAIAIGVTYAAIVPARGFAAEPKSETDPIHAAISQGTLIARLSSTVTLAQTSSLRPLTWQTPSISFPVDTSTAVSQVPAGRVPVHLPPPGSSLTPTNQSPPGSSLSPVNPVPGSSQPPTNQPPPGSSQPPTNPVPAGQNPGVMVPNPQVIIKDSQTPAYINQTIPPLLPKAIAPPVGDLSITNTDASAGQIDLGTSARISRLVLRDTPSRDILAILVRSAGLNFAYTGDPTGGNLPPGQVVIPGGAGGQVYEGPRISIDLENESIQSAFNYILRLSNFEGNRVGNTILIGPKLPNGAKGLTSRSLRLNQISVGSALNFLVAMGAESAISRERTVTTVNAVPVGANFGEGGGNFAGGANNPSVATQTQTSTESRVEVQRVAFQDGQPLLRGLQVVGDERTNTLTLMGNAQQIQIATTHLTQLDSRRRQAVINVRIIDVNLTALNTIGGSFSFGVNDTFSVVDQGLAVINFGTGAPPTIANNNIAAPQQNTIVSASNPDSQLPFSSRFLARLQASISQGSSKILTDPSLTVQEGQTAQVNLTQEVLGGLRTQISAVGSGGSTSLTTQEPIIKQAGLTLSVKIDRIDDNGFISLSVAPTVSAPNGVASAGTSGTITLLSQRSLSSGQLRLRDGQTLVLAGIIQDTDRANVTKVPILGDIPLLGTLFRSTSKNGQRQEVIVLLTPQIVDDSDRATFGYGYIPSPDANKILQRDRQLNPLLKRK